MATLFKGVAVIAKVDFRSGNPQTPRRLIIEFNFVGDKLAINDDEIFLQRLRARHFTLTAEEVEGQVVKQPGLFGAE